jgi:TonB family protein
MGRNADKDPRRVVEEPKRSALLYSVVAMLAVFSLWTFFSSLPDPPTFFWKSRPVPTSVTGSKPAHGDLRALFSGDDYPANAQMNGEQGTVQVRLSIDSAGSVSDCTVIRSSSFRSLDDATCTILKDRAKFRPAHDANGRAVPDTVVSPPVVWRLEG